MGALDSLDNMSEKNQKYCLYGFGFVSLISLIIFIVCMSGYKHLGPDDQIIIKSATGKEAVNGPQALQLNPFKSMEWRKAELLDPLQYAVVQDTLTAVIRHEEGPKLLFLGAYDVLKRVRSKIVLEKDQYVRLVDLKTGNERVVRGPSTVVQSPTEMAPNGTMKAIFLDMETAAIVLNKTNGLKRLVTSCTYDGGVFAPEPLEEVVEVRSLIHVLPHEAMIVRDVNGITTVYSGAEGGASGEVACMPGSNSGQPGTAFFLPPYSKIVRMFWSSYSSPQSAKDQQQRSQSAAQSPASTTTTTTTRRSSTNTKAATSTRVDPNSNSLYATAAQSSTYSGPKVPVVKIDLRARKAFYSYEVRTSDNVKLLLEGTIFWQITDVKKMINMTSDPEGDIWSKSRSILIAAVSNVTLGTFMGGFNDIVMNAFALHAGDDFFSSRGIMLQSMELTRYSCVDAHTRAVLQQIIRETTNRINKLERQKSDNEVREEKMSADIQLENNRTQLIETEAFNARLLAETRGATDGGGVATSIASFIDALNTSLPNVSDRMGLYRMHESLEATKKDTNALATGNASLFIAPKDMDLKLQMPHTTAEL